MPDETYESVLDRGWDEVPEAKDLPNGTWRLKGRNAVYMEPKDQDPKVLFYYKPIMAADDVDTDALDALGADYDLNNNDVVFTVFINNPADWDKVRKHLDRHLGYEPVPGSIRGSMKNFTGSEIMAYVKTRTYTDKSGEFQMSWDAGNFLTPED